VPWETGGLIAAAGGAVVGDWRGVGEAWGSGVAAVVLHAAATRRTSAVAPARDAAVMRVIAGKPLVPAFVLARMSGY
jgi:hypothetical protein